MKRLSVYFLMLSLASLCMTCFDNTSGEIKTEEEIIIKTKSFDSYLHVEFLDANSGEFLREKEVAIAVRGKDAAWVYSNVGSQSTSYKTKAGFYDLAVDISKSAGDFVIEVTTDGYDNFIHHVRLNNAKFSSVRAQLIKKGNEPEGVHVAEPQIITTNPNGETTKEITISPDENNTIILPPGTVFKDENGNVLTGNIESQVTFYDPQESIEFFPGGLDVEVIDANNQSQNVSFTSAGLFDIELASGNNTVKTIEGEGIELTTIVSPDLINPNTGKPVVEGDEIQLWSMDPETAVWKLEKTAFVKKNSSGQLYLSEVIKHLSYWNWDWFTNSCDEGAKIQWTGNVTGANVTVINKTPLDSYHTQTTVMVDVNDPYFNQLQFQWVPMNTPMVLTFEGDGLAFVPAALVITNMCERKTYPVRVMGPSAYKVNIDLNVTAKSNPNVKVSVNGWMYIYKDGSNTAGQSVYMTDSKATAYLEANADYVFSLSLSNAYGYGYTRIDDIGNNKLKISFSPEYVYSYSENMSVIISKQELTINKPADNVINITMTYKVDDWVLNMIK